MTTKISFSELLERSKSEIIAVHTPTEEQAIALLEALDKRGYKWFSGDKLTEVTYYEYENTCYNFGTSNYPCMDKVTYSLLYWYQSDGYTIIEFKDIDFEEKKNNDN